jgi:hypothetical protein
MQLDVLPYQGEVSIIHAAWQDYPRWEPGNSWVAFRAPMLSHPDTPPYPSVVVAAQPLPGPDGPREVRVEVWAEDEPTGLHCVHETVLAVGSVGVNVGNQHGGGLKCLRLDRGKYPFRVLVDADRPEDVTRVVFWIGQRREQ